MTFLLTPEQSELYNSPNKHMFAIGYAATGKTYGCLAKVLKELSEKNKDCCVYIQSGERHKVDGIRSLLDRFSVNTKYEAMRKRIFIPEWNSSITFTDNLRMHAPDIIYLHSPLKHISDMASDCIHKFRWGGGKIIYDITIPDNAAVAMTDMMWVISLIPNEPPHIINFGGKPVSHMEREDFNLDKFLLSNGDEVSFDAV